MTARKTCQIRGVNSDVARLLKSDLGIPHPLRAGFGTPAGGHARPYNGPIKNGWFDKKTGGHSCPIDAEGIPDSHLPVRSALLPEGRDLHRRSAPFTAGVARRRNCIFFNRFNRFAFFARPKRTGLKTQAGGHARPYKLSPNAAGNIPLNQNLGMRDE